jgi:hypothetical protein
LIQFSTFLLLTCLLATSSVAEVMYVTDAQLDEYRIATAKPLEQLETPGVDALHLGEIFEHTLLAMVRETSGVQLDSLQLQMLVEKHQEIAVRVLRARRIVVQPVGEKELADYAELSRSIYFTSHILVPSEVEILSLESRLQSGESFQDLARAHSQDPGSAEQGGFLGAVRSGDTVMEFEECLFHLREGEVSSPLLTPFGWHLIRLDSLALQMSEWTEEDLETYRGRLESYAKRHGELAANAKLQKEHHIQLNLENLSDAAADRAKVAESKHAVLTKGDLNALLERSFGDRASYLGEDLSREFAKYWIERQAWLWECNEASIFEDPEVLDRMDIRERLAKSALYVGERIRPSINPSEMDLFNYLQNHEHEFLEHRAFGLWDFTFTSRTAASKAEVLLKQGSGDPEDLKAELGLEIFPMEVSAAEVRLMSPETRMALVSMDPFTWSSLQMEKVDRRANWHLYHLLGRRMPLLEESEDLEKAVYEKVAADFLSAKISRVIDLMREQTGLESAQRIQ